MPELDALLAQVDPAKPVVVLTGAGISVESGIPTFRGPQGMRPQRPPRTAR